MNHVYFWLTPIAVLAVLLLVGFVGCQLVFQAEPDAFPKTYSEAVLEDLPVSYWRLQETPATTAVPGGAAADEVGAHEGTYIKAAAILPVDTVSRSAGANPLILEIGVQPALITNTANFTAVRVQGGAIRVPFAPELNPLQFTVEAFVSPEWNLNSLAAQGDYYCVLESSDQPAAGSTTGKSRGFAIYAGPEDPTTLQTPYRWQMWVGDGTTFRQLKEVAPNAGSLVTGDPTYLAVTFDGTAFELWVFTSNADIETTTHGLVSVPYVPNDSGDLTIGMSGFRRALLGPPPGPTRFLYPFNGKLEEVAIYDHVLTHEQLAKHVANAFFQ